MNIENVKHQLMKQRTFKAKCLKQAEQYNQASATVELKKDIDALDYVIRMIGYALRKAKEKGVKV